MLHPLIKVKHISTFILAVLLLSCFTLAQAGELSVIANVDKTEATLEDSITLGVKVIGTQNSPAPKLPAIPEFNVQSLGTSSSVQIINMKMTSSVEFSYRLTPTKKGVFTIKPITLAIDDKLFKTEPISLTIKEASTNAVDQNVPVFAQASVSNDKPYVNEQVTLTLRLFRNVDVKNINLNASYDNFRKEDLGKEKEYTQTINGITYSVLELSVALFPTKAGTQEIPPAILDLDVLHRTRERRPSNDPFAHFFDDSFLFGSRARVEHKTLRTDPIILKVQALPETGKPQNYSNMVGQFSISSELGKDQIEVGDSTTLTISISGKGNAKDTPEPKLNLEDHFKVYPDQPEFKQEVENNRIIGKKIFKFALIPLHEGELTIPAITLSYFDPVHKKYSTAQSKSLLVYVKPSKNKESLNIAEAERPKEKTDSVKIIGKDLLPIHTRVTEFEDQGLNTARIVYYALILVTPIIAYVGFAVFIHFKRRLVSDIAYSRKRTAYKNAKNQLKNLSSINDAKGLARDSSKILREYIGDKHNLQGSAYTPGEMAQILKDACYDENMARSIIQLLEKYESMQYSPMHGNGDSPDVILIETSNMLDQMEKMP